MEEYFNKIDTDINLGFISAKQGKARKDKGISIWKDFLSCGENSKYDLLTELDSKVQETANKLFID